MGEKVGFTNCVFEKLCFLLKTLFLQRFQQNPAFQKQKLYDEKTENYEKLWVVFEHGKKVFFGVCFFEVLMLLWFVFVCLLFVFLVFGFLLGVGFVSVCLLCFVLWLDVVVSVSVFCVFLCFLCFFVFLCFFSLCFCFVFCFCLEGLRVR